MKKLCFLCIEHKNNDSVVCLNLFFFFAMEAVSQQPPDYCMACGDCGLTMDYTGMVWNGVILPGPGQDTGTRGMCELTNQSRLLLSTKTCKNILVISINKHNMPHLTVNV